MVIQPDDKRKASTTNDVQGRSASLSTLLQGAFKAIDSEEESERIFCKVKPSMLSERVYVFSEIRFRFILC